MSLGYILKSSKNQVTLIYPKALFLEVSAILYSFVAYLLHAYMLGIV